MQNFVVVKLELFPEISIFGFYSEKKSAKFPPRTLLVCVASQLKLLVALETIEFTASFFVDFS